MKIKKEVKLNLTKQNKITEETNIETQTHKYNPVNVNSSASEKIDFLDNLVKDCRKDSFINILVKEALKINQMNNYQKKVSEINLKENDIEGLYDWIPFINNSRPLSHYIRTNHNKIKSEQNEINNNENIINIRSPQILVDLPNDKMKLFFGKNSLGIVKPKNKNIEKKYSPNFRKKNGKNIKTMPNKNNNNENNRDNNNKNKRKNIKLPTWHFPYKYRQENNKTNDLNEESKTELNNNHIQPISIYGNYGPNNTFYFSDTFSDYYKEDLKSFMKKMPVLKPKIISNPKRLKTEIKKEKHKSYIKEQILYDLIKKDKLILRKQDLIISAKRKNPVPLMKFIYKQEYPNAEEIKEHIRKYFNTMKPYGNDDGKVDYTQNDRWKLNKELIKYRKMEYNLNIAKKNKKRKKLEKNKGKLILNYYDMNDPDLDIFNKLNLDTNDNINNLDILDKQNLSFEYQNHFGNSYDYEIEVKIKAKTIENERKRPRTGFKSAKEINILNKEKEKEKEQFKNRPHSSNIRRSNYLEDRYYFDIKDYNELYKDYLPSNRFPLKTSSKINNTSYNKINELIKERFYKKKLNDNYFITQPDLVINHKVKIKAYNSYNNSKSLYLNNYYGNRNKFKENKNNKHRLNTVIGLKKEKCTMIDFNKYIDTNLDLKMNKINDQAFFSPMNCFNKLAGKYYSSSNNVHIKNRRNKRKQILDFNQKNNSKK